MASDLLQLAAVPGQKRDERASYLRKDGLIVKTNDDRQSATRAGIMQLRSGSAVALGSSRRERRRVSKLPMALMTGTFFRRLGQS
jgi:hypothetical protein